MALAEADHPQLFAFIRRVYEDAGAPRPRRVYASPDVNAALVYNTSLLNLVLPPRKDLLIGLGLVNVVTVAELKAVLAHEFGHFSQRSVGLGSYVYVANRVMHDIIYGRDALDRFVDQWCLKDAGSWRTPAFTNVPAGSSLYSLIVDRGDTLLPVETGTGLLNLGVPSPFRELAGESISGEWLVKLVNRLEGVLRRVKRLHFKSLGSLLTFQEKLVSESREILPGFIAVPAL